MIDEIDKPVKLFRLVTGEDIIAKSSVGDALVFIESPLLIDIKVKEGKPAIILQQWSPTDIIDIDIAGLNPSNVLAVYQPGEEVKEYYLNVITKQEKAKETALKMEEMKKNMSPEDIDEMLDALEESILVTKH